MDTYNSTYVAHSVIRLTAKAVNEHFDLKDTFGVKPKTVTVH
jgi:hypothetical protein